MRANGHAEPTDPPGSLPVALALHGLWQPVATLRALSLALTQGWSARGEEERFELARSIERETASLRDVAEDLTTLGLLDRHAFVPLIRPESPVELLRDAASAVDELGGRLRVHRDAESADLRVSADRGRTLQVLKTFLRRAERCSSEETNVLMRADAFSGTGAGGDAVRFAVDYAGDDMDRVASPFDLQDGAGPDGGSRLGLYLSRRLIEAQGGRVEARSDRGRSTLAFTLPVDPDDARRDDLR